MPTDIVDFSKALTNLLIDEWAVTPVTMKGSGGLDLKGSSENLFHDGAEFIEFEVGVEARSGAGISAASGVRVLGYIDVQMYTNTGEGTTRLADIERQLYQLLERRSLNAAQIRTGVASKPYEFRGRLTKNVSFPFEYFER